MFEFLSKAKQMIPSMNEFIGGFGENLTKWYAKMFADGLTIHDVLIDGAEGYTSQIDLLIIDSYGIFVVEVKAYSEARIYGDGKKEKWYYYLGKQRYEIYSPLKQNAKHIKYLKTFLKDFGDVPCFSILLIVCEEFKVDHINSGDKIDTVVCNGFPGMSNALKMLKKDRAKVYDEAKVKEIYEFIMKNQYRGKAVRREHKQNVIQYKNDLEMKRLERMCPYCNIPLVLKSGRYGGFYGCGNYPKCRHTEKL